MDTGLIFLEIYCKANLGSVNNPVIFVKEEAGQFFDLTNTM